MYIKNVCLKFIPKITFLDRSIFFFVCFVLFYSVAKPIDLESNHLLYQMSPSFSLKGECLNLCFGSLFGCLLPHCLLSILSLQYAIRFSHLDSSHLYKYVLKFHHLKISSNSSSNDNKISESHSLPLLVRVSLPLEPMFSKHLPVFTVFILSYISCNWLQVVSVSMTKTVLTIKLNHSHCVTKSNPPSIPRCCSLNSHLSSLWQSSHDFSFYFTEHSHSLLQTHFQL